MKRTTSSPHGAKPLFYEVTLGGFEAPPQPPTGHVHDAIEISTFEHGSVTMLYGGTPLKIEPDRLVVHWGMLPHQVLERAPGALVVGLHLPLAWALQWHFPPSLLTRVLGLEVIIEPPRKRPCSDLELLRDWNRLLADGDELSREIVLAEVRARLLRLSQRQAGAANEVFSEVHATRVFHAALQYIVRHFREPVLLTDIAKTSDVSIRHLTRLFQQNTGESINAYITALRLSHAMRLLVTTDRTVTDIMYDAGFTCPTHFYSVFRRRTQTTPARYRRGLDGG